MKRFIFSTAMVLALSEPAFAQQAGGDPTQPTEKTVLAPSTEATVQTPVAPPESPKVAPTESKKSPYTGEEGIKLPGDLRINGKFDVSYERIGYTNDLRDGKNALRNYHHFVFLSRTEKEDPFFFTAELTERYFYEFGARFRQKETPLTYTVRMGKIIVPFGGEPTFHHTYGGLTGFDQPVLPVIWAEHGIAGQVKYKGAGWTASNDIYAVQGYQLSATNAVLNLQTDFSDKDNVRGGVGDRVGFGYGPASIWYSAYYNSLGFTRRLFMQAIDFEIYRPTQIPVVRDFVLAAGALRADVSGGDKKKIGGRGKDYYHFADYVELRYYIVDWLSVYGREGLRTFDNREGSYIDRKRLSKEDASAFNVGVTYKRGPFLMQLAHYWNVEKKDETKNDFLRLRMGYEF